MFIGPVISSPRTHQAHQALDQVRDEAERPRLRPLAIDGDRFAPKRLHDEVRYHPAILRMHARTIGIEYPGDLDAQLMLAVIVKEQRLCAALAFIIARPEADRIDIAPVVFGLRVNNRIAVDFRRGCLKDLGTQPLASPSMLIAP